MTDLELIAFAAACMVAFALGAIKGGQR